MREAETGIRMRLRPLATIGAEEYKGKVSEMWIASHGSLSEQLPTLAGRLHWDAHFGRPAGTRVVHVLHRHEDVCHALPGFADRLEPAACRGGARASEGISIVGHYCLFVDAVPSGTGRDRNEVEVP